MNSTERNVLLPMATTSRNTLKDQITGYATMVNQYLDEGWNGHLMVFMFNQLRGGIRTMNHQMQNQIESKRPVKPTLRERGWREDIGV